MVRTDFFGDHEFDVLLELIVPFDAAYPEIQIHVDRLLFELSLQQEAAIAGAMPEGANLGIFTNFEIFRAHAAGARRLRGKLSSDERAKLEDSLGSLVKVTTLGALQYPAIDEHCDRLLYEVGNALGGGTVETFEKFHHDLRKERSTVNLPVRGQG